jgi:ketosteroid isomerase-like protein
MILIAAVPVLLAIVAAGLGGWVYLNGQDKTSVRAVDPSDNSTPEIVQNTPAANTSDSTSKVVLDDMSEQTNSNSEPSSTSGSESVKKEIAEAVELWRKAIEARKVPDYLNKYAEKVDYFDKTGVGTAEIRVEAQKMFETYSDIDITLTNVRVAVDPDGTQATAVFDKEWSYETDKDLLEGKAHTKLRFQKNGRDWKIIGEKYQKIYYMEN